MDESTCSVEECDKKLYCRGWCIMHYRRWKRTGSLDVALPNVETDDLPDEVWRGVVGYEGQYEVSNFGRVRSLSRVFYDSIGRLRPFPGQLLAASPNSDGYPRVTLPDPSRPLGQVIVLIHQLVLTAFVGPCPLGMECCHGDGDRANNRLTNLRWDTRSANQQDTLRHGRHHMRNRTHCPRDHLLQTPNLVAHVAAQGYRQCLACARAENIRRTARLRGEILDLRTIADEQYARIMAA